MSTNVATLSADLVIGTTSFNTGLNKADNRLLRSKSVWAGALKSTEQNFATLNTAVGTLSKNYQLLAGAVALVAGSGFVMIARNALNAAGALQDTSDRLQITTTEFQRFAYASKLVGIDADKLEGGITKLNAKIADGSLKYKDATEGLFSIADAVKKARTGSEKLAIVNDAFGNKLGAKFLPLLQNGADGLRALGDEAERTGNVISQNTIVRADEFADKLDILGATIKNNFQGAFLSEFTDQSGEIQKIYSDPDFINGIQEIGKAFGGMAMYALQAVSAIGQLIGKLNEFDEAKQSFSDKLDNKFFNFLDEIDRKLGRGALVDARLAKQSSQKYEVYGPPAPKGVMGPPSPQAAAANQNVRAWQMSGDTNETAAKAAAMEAQRRAKLTQDVLNGLKLESAQLKLQISMYGQKESSISRAQKQLNIENQLRQNGITLTAAQKKAVTEYLDTIEKQNDLLKTQENQQKRLEEKERDREQALNQLGASFSSAFEDAIVGGEELSDVLQGLLDDILRLITRVSITEPLGNALVDFFKDSGGGTKSSGGGIGGFFSNLFGGSFATGTDFVPRDMIAKVHRGERITPAYQNNPAKMNGAGGGAVTINVINNSNARVRTSSSDGDGGTDIRIALDDQVAGLVGSPSSKTAQALSARASKTYIRR